MFTTKMCYFSLILVHYALRVTNHIMFVSRKHKATIATDDTHTPKKQNATKKKKTPKKKTPKKKKKTPKKKKALAASSAPPGRVVKKLVDYLNE